MTEFFESITPEYVIVCLASFSVVIYTIYRIVIRTNDDNNEQDDEDRGGPIPPKPPKPHRPVNGKVIKEELEEVVFLVRRNNHPTHHLNIR